MKPTPHKSIHAKRKSHPTRVRGLKLDSGEKVILFAQSHPTRVRGLKLAKGVHDLIISCVAPHAGAWIETLRLNANAFRDFRRTPRGCVD